MATKLKIERRRASEEAKRPLRRPRLAAQVARTIEDRILAGQWPIGFQIGREAELAIDFGVSRWTLREAVRILEASGFVETRKGGGGGLFVASSAHDFVCKMVSNYFEFIRVGRDEFAAVMAGLVGQALDQSVAQLTAAGRQDIQARLDAIGDLPLARQLEEAGAIYRALIDGSDNPVLALFLGALMRITSNAAIYSDLDDAEWYGAFATVIDATKNLGRSALDGDLTGAHVANDRVLGQYVLLFESSQLHLRKSITETATARAYGFFPPSRPTKKADHVERAIREMIFGQTLPPGAGLGSEADLLDRFRVGRWVLREALRSLEQLGVVEMGWGWRSGLRVVAPDPAMVAQACCRQLRRERVRRRHLMPVAAMLRDLGRPEGGHTPIVDFFWNVLDEVQAQA